MTEDRKQRAEDRKQMTEALDFGFGIWDFGMMKQSA
jgi:hypothetical protein